MNIGLIERTGLYSQLTAYMCACVTDPPPTIVSDQAGLLQYTTIVDSLVQCTTGRVLCVRTLGSVLRDTTRKKGNFCEKNAGKRTEHGCIWGKK